MYNSLLFIFLFEGPISSHLTYVSEKMQHTIMSVENRKIVPVLVCGIIMQIGIPETIHIHMF